jgi:hypothetical protein
MRHTSAAIATETGARNPSLNRNPHRNPKSRAQASPSSAAHIRPDLVRASR